jgi:hypothetical protein
MKRTPSPLGRLVPHGGLGGCQPDGRHMTVLAALSVPGDGDRAMGTGRGTVSGEPEEERLTSDSVIRGARARASRGDLASMARLATALQARGLCCRDVARHCYGADFPAEFFVIARDRLRRPHELETFTNQPWNLCVPSGEGGPPLSPTAVSPCSRACAHITPRRSSA